MVEFFLGGRISQNLVAQQNTQSSTGLNNKICITFVCAVVDIYTSATQIYSCTVGKHNFLVG